MACATRTGFSISNRLRTDLARAKGILRTFVRRRAESEGGPAFIDTPWQQYWGETYGPDLKRWLLKPIFTELEKKGHVGDLIVDVGSGAAPVTRLLQKKAGRRRICVDIAATNGSSADEQRIRGNVEGLDGGLGVRKALVRASRFLGLDPRAGGACLDAVVFSDILNYVDFRKVLRCFADYLKRGGRIVIVNLPIRGNRALFSDRGLKDNRELYQFLEEHRFEIEHKSFPCRPRNETDESEELIVLVARKCH